MSNKLIVILGPTASGKTALSIKLAKKFQGEIVSADSRQVYKGLNIGTGKISKKEMQAIPHFLLDVASPKRRFSVAQYQKLGIKAIKNIVKRRKLAFLVGGSPFYIYSIVEGWQFPKRKPDWQLRKKLEKKTTQELFKILKNLSPTRAKSIEKKNKRRLIRAIEIAKTLGRVPKLKKAPQFNCLLLGVKKTKEELKQLIQKRLLKRLRQGMIAEVRKLKRQGLSWQRLDEFGLEYRWLAKFLQNKISREQMLNGLQKDIEKFAKRQMTWFKRDPQGEQAPFRASKKIHWIANQGEAEKLIKHFLN